MPPPNRAHHRAPARMAVFLSDRGRFSYLRCSRRWWLGNRQCPGSGRFRPAPMVIASELLQPHLFLARLLRPAEPASRFTASIEATVSTNPIRAFSWVDCAFASGRVRSRTSRVSLLWRPGCILPLTGADDGQKDKRPPAARLSTGDFMFAARTRVRDLGRSSCFGRTVL